MIKKTNSLGFFFPWNFAPFLAKMQLFFKLKTCFKCNGNIKNRQLKAPTVAKYINNNIRKRDGLSIIFITCGFIIISALWLIALQFWYLISLSNRSGMKKKKKKIPCAEIPFQTKSKLLVKSFTHFKTYEKLLLSLALSSRLCRSFAFFYIVEWL